MAANMNSSFSSNDGERSSLGSSNGASPVQQQQQQRSIVKTSPSVVESVMPPHQSNVAIRMGRTSGGAANNKMTGGTSSNSMKNKLQIPHHPSVAMNPLAASIRSLQHLYQNSGPSASLPPLSLTSPYHHHHHHHHQTHLMSAGGSVASSGSSNRVPPGGAPPAAPSRLFQISSLL